MQLRVPSRIEKHVFGNIMVKKILIRFFKLFKKKGTKTFILLQNVTVSTMATGENSFVWKKRVHNRHIVLTNTQI